MKQNRLGSQFLPDLIAWTFGYIEVLDIYFCFAKTENSWK